MLSKIYMGGGLALLVALALASGAAWLFRSQRDLARSEVATARAERDACAVARDAARAEAKGAADAAARCAGEFDADRARCDAALVIVNADAARLRQSLKACQTDDAVAGRLGEVTQ